VVGTKSFPQEFEDKIVYNLEKTCGKLLRYCKINVLGDVEKCLKT